MEKEQKEKTKMFIWGVIAGAVVSVIVIFWAGIAVTQKSANQKAEWAAEEAVVDKLAAICASQFPQDPEKDRKLKELKEIDKWKRGDYVKKQSWAKIPGIENPSSSVFDECAERILKASK